MARRSDIRLTREGIVAAALTVAARGEAPTGQALGDELGVDRSAIWRHFRDKDDLLVASADALIAPVRDGMPPADDPIERLRWVWEGTQAAFIAHPRIGEQLGARFVSGPNAIAVIDVLIDAFRRLGAPDTDAVHEYRAFIDMTLSYSAMIAAHALLDARVVSRDIARTVEAVRTLPAAERESLNVDIEAMISVSATPGETIFANYAAGVRARLANSAESGQK